MSKSKKSKKQSRIRANARSIIIVVILITIFSGVSFYLGMATPRTFTTPVNLSGFTLSLNDDITVIYGPAHTGIRITFQVTSQSHSWTLDIRDINGAPVGMLSDWGTGIFSTPWLYAPGGCIILIHSSSSSPTSMNLDGILIISSRFPFI